SSNNVPPLPVALARGKCCRAVAEWYVPARTPRAAHHESPLTDKTRTNAAIRSWASAQDGRPCGRDPVCRARRLALPGPPNRCKGATTQRDSPVSAQVGVEHFSPLPPSLRYAHVRDRPRSTPIVLSQRREVPQTRKWRALE